MTESAVAMVGRASELSAFDAAIAGGATPILIVGDAGIGKTRFVTAALEQQRARGSIALVGHCLPLSSPLPLLPLASALRQLVRHDNGRLIRSALGSAAPYVRQELGRLLPELADEAMSTSAGGPSSPGDWERQRLFAAVGDVLTEVARSRSVVLAVEDLHWADQTTVDALTYLHVALGGTDVAIAVTCRDDEAAPAEHVQTWLLNLRRQHVMELGLTGLTPQQVGELVTSLRTGLPVPTDDVVRQLALRSEGNPFYVEQLVAAGLSAHSSHSSGRLPNSLAALLVDRFRHVSGDARLAMSALAIVARPAPEELIGAVTGLDPARLRRALRDLAAAKLLTDAADATGYATRHALLAEAVRHDLLESDRRDLHARAAEALESTQDPGVIAEVAEHWRLARRPAEELEAVSRAAAAADQVFATREAAEFWLRAIQLWKQLPDVAADLKVDPLQMHLSALQDLRAIGMDTEARELAEQAYRRFAGGTDVRSEAELLHLVSQFRWHSDPDSAISLLDTAVDLYERLPPSAGQAGAMMARAGYQHDERDIAATVPDIRRALHVAESVGDLGTQVKALVRLAMATLVQGDVPAGFGLFARGRGLLPSLEAAGDALFPIVMLCVNESDACLRTGRLADAERIALEGLAVARRIGEGGSSMADFLIGNAMESLLERGETDLARGLLAGCDAISESSHWVRRISHIEIDLRDGLVEDADRAMAALALERRSNAALDREVVLDAAEIAIWARRPLDVAPMISRCAADAAETDEEIHWGGLLVLGARAVADIAEAARARRDSSGFDAALDSLRVLEEIVDQMGGRPFSNHPFVVRVRVDRCQWEAERGRALGQSDRDAWAECAQGWDELGRPHRAAYAWWRCAEASLLSGAGAAAAAFALRSAASRAVGMVPLQREIQALARRGRVALEEPAAIRAEGTAAAPSGVVARDPYGLTERERSVLHLVAAGRTNVQIGAALFISPKTASVHVTNILRKLEVDNRTQAAAVAERAGILADHALISRST